MNENFGGWKAAVERPLGIEGAVNPLCGLFERTIGGKRAVVEYEADRELRDSEQVPFGAEGGIEGFLTRGVLPYAGDVWYNPGSVKCKSPML